LEFHQLQLLLDLPTTKTAGAAECVEFSGKVIIAALHTNEVSILRNLRRDHREGRRR
jgi:hypothetical protein